MKAKKIFSLALAAALSASAFAGCTQTGGGSGSGGAGGGETAANGDGIVDMTFFAAMSGKDKNDGNEIQELIAQKTGVRVKESWLTGQDAGEAIGSIIASGKLPDFIDGGDGCIQLYENHLLVAWDDYLEKYPNLKEMYTPEEWDKFRMSDGKIYWANVFGNHYQKDTTTGHNGEAFWIQVRVLEWANYPKIETLDQYFDLLEQYAAANPTMPDGTPVIPYTCLCEDWKYYCLENAPMFLDGYPNDGCVIVDVSAGAMNPKVVDYNTTSTAKMYFQKLNEEYAKGAIDADFATQTYDEYIAKLSTGRVLGLCDQYWDFAYNIMGPFAQTQQTTDGTTYRLDEMGCDYVPLGLVAKAGMEQQWHSYGDELNQASGIAVTTSCKDPDLAFAFLNAMLDQEIHDLRFWGIKDVDYLVDENGLYYRDDTMRENWKSDSYKAKHTCEYSYFL
jgi:putative aldouronate transport system substrate-binding protein